MEKKYSEHKGVRYIPIKEIDGACTHCDLIQDEDCLKVCRPGAILKKVPYPIQACIGIKHPKLCEGCGQC